jgi:hypothetical protein
MGPPLVKPQKRRDLKFRFSRGNPFRELAPGELLLEQISDRQLRAARDHGQRILNYQTRQFFELEALRAAHRDKITDALQSVPGVPIDVTGWCRAIKGRYAHALLSCVGSMKQSGRFNVGADVDGGQRFPIFPALYVASDRATAHCEMFGHVQPGSGLSAEALALQSDTSILWLALTGMVSNVFDLTQERNLVPFLKATSSFRFSRDFRAYERSLGIKPVLVANTTARLMATFMDPSWRAFAAHVDLPANSQVFGGLAAAAGFEGIRYKSARTGGDALAIFPRAFRNSASVIRVCDPHPGAHCIELSATTFTDCERFEW